MTRTQKLVGAGVAAVVVLAIVAFLYLRDTSPPAPTLADAAAQVDATDDATADADASAQDDAAEDEAVSSPEETAAEDEPAAVAEVDGTWSIDTTVGEDIDSGTFAGYRVSEELRTIGETTAFGRSPEVQGDIVIAGDLVESIDVTVDMTALESDSGNRDNAIRTRGLETSSFPTATFSSTAPVELPAGAADGEQFQVEVDGELTLHGVTNEVTVPLEAQLVGERIVVVSSFPITMSDYDITPPQVGPVLSIADEGTMELQLFLTKA